MLDFTQTAGETASLEDFLAAAGQPDGFTGEGSAFAITDDDTALWAVRRVAQAQREIDRVKRQAQVELDRINAWVEANTVKAQGTVDYFESLLGDYLVSVRDDERDGRKSITFPDGTVTSRVTPGKVKVEDVDAFIAWADANGHSDWVRVKRDADVAAVKKVADLADGLVLDPLTGAVVPGLLHEEGGLSVSVKVAD